MIKIFYAVFDALLVFYFIRKAVRSQSSIYLLGIPFLQFMSQTIFFEKEEYYWTKFTGLDGVWAIVLTIFLAWLITFLWYCRKNQEIQRSPFSFFLWKPIKQEIPIMLLSGLWLINIAINSFRFMDLGGLFISSLDVGSIFIGYILVRGIVTNTDLQNIIGFIESLCIITAISAMFFFIQQGLNINVFAVSYSVELTFMGGVVRRSTWFFPPLTLLLFSYGLSARRWDVFIAIGWLFALLAYFFSYTRTYIVAALFLIFFAFALKFLKSHSLKPIKTLIIVISMFIAGGWIISWLMPVQSQYLITRLSQGFNTIGSQDSTLTIRWTWITNTWQFIKPNYILGIGSPGIKNYPNQFWTDQWVWDSWIVSVLQYWGVIGFALIILLFYSGLRLAIKLFSSQNEKVESMGLLFILVLSGVLIEGIFGPIFMDFHRYPLGFWYFALLAGTASKAREFQRSEIVIQKKQMVVKEQEIHPDSLLGRMKDVADPRRHAGRIYPLWSMLAMLVLAAINGQRTLRGMWLWNIQHWKIIASPLGFSNLAHPPGYGTLRSVLKKLDSIVLLQTLSKWGQEIGGAENEDWSLTGKVPPGNRRVDSLEESLRVINLTAKALITAAEQQSISGRNQLTTTIDLMNAVPLDGQLVAVDSGVQRELAIQV